MLINHQTGCKVFEDVNDAIEYIEENSEVTFDKFIKAHKSLSTKALKK